MSVFIFEPTGSSASHVRQKGHEPRPFDGLRDRVLAYGGAARLPAAHNSAVTIYELFEQFDVLVVHVHRAGTLPVHENRILFARTGASLFLAATRTHGK